MIECQRGFMFPECCENTIEIRNYKELPYSQCSARFTSQNHKSQYVQLVLCPSPHQIPQNSLGEGQNILFADRKHEGGEGESMDHKTELFLSKYRLPL